MLKILTNRIEAKARDFIGRNQFGFRKGCGTRGSLEFGNNVYICFVDFEKAFDRVNWEKMIQVLLSIGVDWGDRRMINELYMNQESVVRVAGGELDLGIIGRRVR